MPSPRPLFRTVALALAASVMAAAAAPPSGPAAVAGVAGTQATDGQAEALQAPAPEAGAEGWSSARGIVVSYTADADAAAVAEARAVAADAALTPAATGDLPGAVDVFELAPAAGLASPSAGGTGTADLAAAASRLAALPQVASVSPNAPVRLEEFSPQTVPLPEVDWHVGGPFGTPPAPVAPFGTDAASAWASGLVPPGDVGPRAYVAVVDTAVDVDHPQLAPLLWRNPGEVPDNGVDDDGNGRVDDISGWDFGDGDADVRPAQGDTHGTGVAGVVASLAPPGGGVGVLPVKFFSDNGDGFTVNAVAAIDYVVDLKRRHRVNIVAVTASWSGPGTPYNYAVSDALRRAGDAGIVVAAAAGNYSTDLDVSPRIPAAYSCATWWRAEDCVVSVSAIDRAGALASWSSFGAQSVDLAAPGVDVRSLAPSGGRRYFHGTSAAAPHVAAAVALCARAAGASYSLRVLLDAIDLAASPTPSVAGSSRTGGRLDVAALVRACAQGSPAFAGALASVRPAAGGVQVAGWARTSGPPLTLAAAPVSQVPSAGPSLPTFTGSVILPLPAGAFDVFVPLPAGEHTVCLAAGDVSSGACRTFTKLADGPPLADDVEITLTADGWGFVGRVADPQAADPVRLRATDDAGRVLADGAASPSAVSVWQDVELPLPAGRPAVRQVCLTATGAGGSRSLGCQRLWSGVGNPQGSLDVARTGGPATVRLVGWAVDPDVPTPLGAHVYVDGRFHSAAVADVARPDVARVYPGPRPTPGFDIAVGDLPPGARQLCVFALNAGAGTANTLVGCRTVVVPGGNPQGSLDVARPAGTGVRVAGWALDGDTAGPVGVHVYVDGWFKGAYTADGVRGDVARAWPGFGDRRGFDVTVAVRQPGVRTVCVFAINAGAGTANTLLGCRAVAVGR